MRQITVAILYSSIALAQNPAVAAAVKSPAALARYMESDKAIDWKGLWNDLATAAPQEPFVPCGKIEDDPCSVEIVNVANPEQAMVIIQRTAYRGHDVYLRYLKKQNGGWRFAGKRVVWVSANYPRRHEIALVGAKRFLKISSDHSQTGVALQQEVEEWFDLTQPGLEPVFSFMPQGSYAPFSFAVGRTVHAVATATHKNDRDSIDLILEIHFVGPGLDIPVIYVGVYDRPSGATKFTPRQAYLSPDRREAMPTQDFEDVGGVDFIDIDPARLVFYAFSGLEKIASGNDKDAREWLRFVLDQIGDTPEKRKLLDRLAGHQPE